MSPRSTHALHKVSDLKHLPPVVLVGLKRCHLSGQRVSAAQPGGAVEDGRADGLGSAEAGRLELGQRQVLGTDPLDPLGRLSEVLI
jgi:hypothetical protein